MPINTPINQLRETYRLIVGDVQVVHWEMYSFDHGRCLVFPSYSLCIFTTDTSRRLRKYVCTYSDMHDMWVMQKRKNKGINSSRSDCNWKKSVIIRFLCYGCCVILLGEIFQ